MAENLGECDNPFADNPQKSRISARQERAAVCIAVGKTVAATAREVGLNAATIWGWYKQPPFTERIEELRKEITDRAIGRLADLMAGKAVDKLIERLDRVDPETGQTSATLDDIKAAFDLFGGLKSTTDLQAKLDRLLEQLNEGGKQ